MSLENWWAKAKMHSVGRRPPFSCMAVKAGTISSISVISSSQLRPMAGLPTAARDRSSTGTVWSSSHSSGGRLSGSQASSSCRSVVPGAAEAGDDDRGVHGLVGDGRLPRPEVDHAQAVLQDQLQLAPGAEAAGQVEAGLVVRARRRGGAKGSSHQASPKSSRPVVAWADWRSRSGLERDHGAAVVTQAVAQRDHLLGPGAARRRGPGHGAQP